MGYKFEQNTSKSKDIISYKMLEEMELLPFLIEAMPQRGRNSVKSILARGQVQVDDYMVTKYNYQLKKGQIVEILKNKAAAREDALIGLNIEYEDDDIIVVHKDAGLLSVAVDRKKQLTAHGQLMDYARKQGPQNRVFVVHRLDRDTSGLMMFAKNEKSKYLLQRDWETMAKERSYLALVEGDVKQEKGVYTSWLNETKTHVMFSSQTKGDGLLAVTHYEKVQSNGKFSLMEVELETGRKNQIRVHMQDLGHSIVGDKKYGAKGNPIGRLGLHAKALAFLHPTSKKLMHFDIDAPEIFYRKSN